MKGLFLPNILQGIINNIIEFIIIVNIYNSINPFFYKILKKLSYHFFFNSMFKFLIILQSERKVIYRTYR